MRSRRAAVAEEAITDADASDQARLALEAFVNAAASAGAFASAMVDQTTRAARAIESTLAASSQAFRSLNGQDLGPRLLAAVVQRLCRDTSIGEVMTEAEALRAMATWIERHRRQRRVAGRKGGRPRKQWPAELGAKPSRTALDLAASDEEIKPDSMKRRRRSRDRRR